MSDQSPVLPLSIGTYSRWSAAANNRLSVNFNSNITWPLANAAFYIPMFIPFSYPVKRVFWCNSSSIGSANVDFGIYTESGTRLYSTGSTVTVGASLAQYTATELLLTQGAYYFAVSCSTVTASKGPQGTTSLTVPVLALMGVLQETIFPLPNTMNPVPAANSMYPYCGVARTTTGF